MIEVGLSLYASIGLFLLWAIGLSLVLLGLSYLRSKRNKYKEKLVPYECGFDAFEGEDNIKKTARFRFDVRFYLVAILFIIFDLEIAFLFPWAIQLKQLGLFGFISMMIFLSVLTVGFIYEWRKGALEWE